MAGRVMSRVVAIVAIASLVMVTTVRPAQAQADRAQPPVLPKQLKSLQPQREPVRMVAEDPNSERTRDQLMQLLDRYPPSVGRVLKLDQSLLANAEYLDTYPALKVFLAEHPDVARDPGYYFERIRVQPAVNDSRPSTRIWEMLLDWIGGLCVATIIAFSLTWLIRTLVDYRRWYRLSKVQADAHGKLLDRLTANDELLAYVQSTAGSQFLQSAPIALDPGSRRIGAPLGRILWSLQAGAVLLALGGGLRYLSGQITDEGAQPIFALGVLAVALGIGFVVSSGISYAMSKHLGLLDGSRPSDGRSA